MPADLTRALIFRSLGGVAGDTASLSIEQIHPVHPVNPSRHRTWCTATVPRCCLGSDAARCHTPWCVRGGIDRDLQSHTCAVVGVFPLHRLCCWKSTEYKAVSPRRRFIVCVDTYPRNTARKFVVDEGCDGTEIVVDRGALGHNSTVMRTVEERLLH